MTAVLAGRDRRHRVRSPGGGHTFAHGMGRHGGAFHTAGRPGASGGKTSDRSKDDNNPDVCHVVSSSTGFVLHKRHGVMEIGEGMSRRFGRNIWRRLDRC